MGENFTSKGFYSSRQPRRVRSFYLFSSLLVSTISLFPFSFPRSRDVWILALTKYIFLYWESILEHVKTKCFNSNTIFALEKWISNIFNMLSRCLWFVSLISWLGFYFDAVTCNVCTMTSYFTSFYRRKPNFSCVRTRAPPLEFLLLNYPLSFFRLDTTSSFLRRYYVNWA